MGSESLIPGRCIMVARGRDWRRQRRRQWTVLLSLAFSTMVIDRHAVPWGVTAVAVDNSNHTTVYPCGPDVGILSVAGSSVVRSTVQIWVEGYRTHCPRSSVTVEAGGTPVGASRVCGTTTMGASTVTRPPVDIGMMVRPFAPTEAVTTDEVTYTCTTPEGISSASGVPMSRYRSVTQIPIAWDGVALVVQPFGIADRCIQSLGGGLTVEQVRWIFSNYTVAQLLATGWRGRQAVLHSDNNDTTHLWSELSNTCPDKQIFIAGPDVTSGTYEFFAHSIFMDRANGESVASGRSNSPRPYVYYNKSRYDDVAWEFESGYVGEDYGDGIAIIDVAYFCDPTSELLLSGVGIRNRNGATVVPNATNVPAGDYDHLSRTLYWQINRDDETLIQARPFVQFALSNAGTRWLSFRYGGAMALSLEDRNVMLARLGAPNVSDWEDLDTLTLPPSPSPLKQCRPLVQAVFGLCIEGCGIVSYVLGFCKNVSP